MWTVRTYDWTLSLSPSAQPVGRRRENCSVARAPIGGALGFLASVNGGGGWDKDVMFGSRDMLRVSAINLTWFQMIFRCFSFFLSVVLYSSRSVFLRRTKKLANSLLLLSLSLPLCGFLHYALLLHAFKGNFFYFVLFCFFRCQQNGEFASFARLHSLHGAAGLEIVLFPCAQFGGQEHPSGRKVINSSSFPSPFVIVIYLHLFLSYA